MTVKEKIESLITAANTTTGESATDLTSAVQDLVDGYGAVPTIEALSVTANGTYTAPSGVNGYNPVTVNVPVGDIGYYATGGGFAYYTKIMNFPSALPTLSYCTKLEEIHAPNATSIANEQARGCSNLRVFDAPNITSLWKNYAFADCSSLTELYFPKTGDMGALGCFGWTTALQTVQFGSIGHAVPNSTLNIFIGDYQSNLTITIYVADDAVLPYPNAPWGAVNATIIYRSATTGEVLTP